MNLLDLSEQEIIRRTSLDELKAMGIEPYPAAQYHVNAYSESITKNFKEDEDREVVVAGRIMIKRTQGKSTFIELQDKEGRIQIYVNRDVLCPDEDKELYNTVLRRLLDYGDIIGIKGTVFKTRMGEISIRAKELTLLSKSLRPLPVVKQKDGVNYDEFTDPEQRHRQRYVDLLVNEGIRETFLKRTKIFNSMRNYFNEKGYIEVDTPVLQSIPGGAAARPFITHHNALDIPMYLRISNELYLKRLIVGGFDGVYEFSRNFRNEGMDRTHNPEFTILEIYVAYTDYHWMMKFTEGLIERTAMEVLGTTDIKVGDTEISLKAPFKRVTMLGSIKEHTGIDISGMDEAELRQVCDTLGVENDETMGKGKLIDEIFGEKCEGKYIQPTFITDYPKEMSPLSKVHREDKSLTERFELMINGKEIANAYSELNDPIDQLARFEEQADLQAEGDDEAMFVDRDYVRALEYGMPPTSGLGIGMDRFIMLLTGEETIQEVLLFPHMRPERTVKKDAVSKYTELGFSEEIVPVLQRAGYSTISDLQGENAQKVRQAIGDVNKKYKLELELPSVDDITACIDKIEE